MVYRRGVILRSQTTEKRSEAKDWLPLSPIKGIGPTGVEYTPSKGDASRRLTVIGMVIKNGRQRWSRRRHLSKR